MVVLSCQSDKNSCSYSSKALGNICRHVERGTGDVSQRRAKGSSRLVGGDTCGARAQGMRLDNVVEITSRTAAGLCEPAER